MPRVLGPLREKIMTTANRGLLFLHHGRTVKLITEDTDSKGTVHQCVDDFCKAADETIAEYIANACNLYNPNKQQKKRRA